MPCGHDGCRCEVEQSGEFCSDHCREHAADEAHGSHECACGHPACEASGAEGEALTRQELQEAFE